MVEISCKLHVDILYRNYNVRVRYGIQYVYGYKDMYSLFNFYFIKNKFKLNNIHSVEVNKITDNDATLNDPRLHVCTAHQNHGDM